MNHRSLVITYYIRAVIHCLLSGSVYICDYVFELSKVGLGDMDYMAIFQQVLMPIAFEVSYDSLLLRV